MFVTFLWHFVEFPFNTAVAVVAGALLHVGLKALWVKYFGEAKAEAKKIFTSVVPKA